MVVTTLPRADELPSRIMASAMSSGTSSDATTSDAEGRTAAAGKSYT